METVFSYSLKNECFDNISDIEVYDSGTVKCTYEDSETTYQISDSVIKEIYGIINRFPELMQMYDIFDIFYPYALDGFSNRFIFSNGEKSNIIIATNLGYFKDNDSVENKTANILIQVFEEITGLLAENGIDSKYLSL
ncbi:MAG: hypothetical protein K2G36_11610 [Ruminococcus sp.]|nr:hypothetical protein [Ruminococcus sp.]